MEQEKKTGKQPILACNEQKNIFPQLAAIAQTKGTPPKPNINAKKVAKDYDNKK